MRHSCLNELKFITVTQQYTWGGRFARNVATFLTYGTGRHSCISRTPVSESFTQWSLRYEPGVLGWASCPVLPYHWLVPHWFDRFIINHRNKLGWWVCVTTVANILNYIFKTSTNCKIWREPICRVTLLWLFVNVWSVVYRKISHTFVFLIDIMDIIYIKSCLVLLAGTLLRHE